MALAPHQPRSLSSALSRALLQPVGTAWQRTLALRIICDQTFRGEYLTPLRVRQGTDAPCAQCFSGPTGTA